MKKNRMMRLASGLLVAVLLSTSVISGTFAKYVTEATATDKARVAKWGVRVEALSDAANTLFEEEYAKTDSNYTLGANSVISTGGDVVAPGTSGTLSQFAVTGTPEVATRVSYAAELTLTGWEYGPSPAEEYCPIVFTVNGTDYKIDGTITSVADLKTAVEAAIAAVKQDYQPNVNLAASVPADLAVSWSWPFEGDDAKDTALGNLATAPTIELDVTCTVTQID